jgi:hypothetical protein
MVAGDEGGRVFIRSELSFVWDAGDEAGRRLAAVQLVRIKAASLLDVAAAFAVSTVTLWRWCKELDASGAAGLAWRKRGPKGPSRLTDDMAADIRGRRSGGATLQAVAAVAARRCRRSPTQSGCRSPRSGGHWPHPRQLSPPSRNKTSGRPQSWTCRCCHLRATATVSGPRPGGGSCPTPNPCSPPPPRCPWRDFCWRSPPWRPPACCLVPHRFWVPAQRFLRPGHHAGRGRVAGPGR